MLAAFCAFALAAAAQTRLSPQLENDCFSPGGGDHDYTHGTCAGFAFAWDF